VIGAADLMEVDWPLATRQPGFQLTSPVSFVSIRCNVDLNIIFWDLKDSQKTQIHRIDSPPLEMASQNEDAELRPRSDVALESFRAL
jgi:hypothetical protein